MRNFLLMITLCLCSVVSHARTYYVANNGNNSNAGTITAPFATWDKLSTVMVAGDIAYIRGGTYRSTKGNGGSVHCLFQNLHGTALNPIKILAYPGEFPILNLDNITPTYTDPTGIVLSNSEYVQIKGLRITGLKQHTGGSGISRGFDLQNASNNTIEFVELDHIGGNGFIISDGSNDNLFKNCDAHHLDDRYSNPGAWGGSNGWNCTGGTNATRTTFDGCRAWWVSDDGFDLFGTNGINTFKNCWSFWNGFEPGTFTPRGDGDGFKLGPDESYIYGGSSTVHNTLLRTLTNCLAFENKQHGFNQNVGDMKCKLYNNTSFKNGHTGYMWDFVSPAPTQDFKNNVSINDTYVRRGAETDGSYNTWNGGVTTTAADFLTISSAGADGPRQADGSLPILNFMRLASNSDLVNSGTNVGLPFVGAAPDRGAFEAGSTLPVKLIDFTATIKTGNVLLQWATSMEANSDYFMVERSLDGVNFTPLGTVNATGTSSIRVNYNFTDIAPQPGVNFYRLKMVDKDRQFEYSKIVSVVFKNSTTGSIEIITADANDNILKLNLISSRPQEVKVSLHDAAGKLLFITGVNLQKGMNNVSRKISLAGAIYYCSVFTGEETLTVPLLKR